ncbi:MAG: M23 family metallopeptidase [Treponema sp.]|nr:M23 family metallopeptidase [Treponema sp.]
MIDTILSEQIVNGRKYSSPLISKDGTKQVIFSPRRVNTDTNVVVQRQSVHRQPILHHQSNQPSRKSPLYQPRSAVPQRLSENQSVKSPIRIPVFYIVLIAVVLIFSIVTLTWQTLAATSNFFDIEPAMDDSLEVFMADYAGLTERPAVGEDFLLQVTETFSFTSYTVQSGDSVSKIASQNSVSMDAIIALNNLSQANLLPVGKVIKIPNMDGIPYTVKSGDTYDSIAKAMNVPLFAIVDANDIQSKDDIAPGKVLFIPGARMSREAFRMALGDYFIWPINNNRITSPYGWRTDPVTGKGRRVHEGIDLAATVGVPIKAAMDGRVVAASIDPVYGKYIIISHPNGLQTLYAHMNAFAVKDGNYVYQGTKIGEVGATGYVTGPHLHFGVYKNGKSVNPLIYLK